MKALGDLVGLKDRLALAEAEVEDSQHDEHRKEDQEDGASEVEPADAEQRLGELEQFENIARSADDLCFYIALACREDYRLHSSSLRSPFIKAHASRDKSAMYATTAATPMAGRSISTKLATMNMESVMKPSRTKNPSKADA